MERSGKGDPAKSIALLWRNREATPIGRSGLTIDRIVATAIEIADEQGITDLSMRAIAKRLNVGAMSLYTHIPGKSELIDLMLDTAWLELGNPNDPARDWRGNLQAVAQAEIDLFLRHRWMLYIIETRPVIGPNILIAWDVLLQAIDGIGLTEVEMDRISSLIGGFATMAARRIIELANVERETGQTLDTWWQANEPLLTQVMDTSRTPTAERVGGVVQEGDFDPQRQGESIRFQLDVILDGIELIVNRRR